MKLVQGHCESWIVVLKTIVCAWGRLGSDFLPPTSIVSSLRSGLTVIFPRTALILNILLSPSPRWRRKRERTKIIFKLFGEATPQWKKNQIIYLFFRFFSDEKKASGRNSAAN